MGDAMQSVLRIVGLCMCGGLALGWAGKPQQGSASTPAADPAVDSANAARSHYRRAIGRLSDGDTTAALLLLDSAARAFPPQPSYADALLHLAVRARNAQFATVALHHANAVGMAVPAAARLRNVITSDRDLMHATELQREMGEQARLGANMNAGSLWRSLRDSTLFPEGLAYDSRSQTMYVTSIAHRNVLVVDKNGAERWLMPNLPENVGGLYGVAIDTARAIVWAASAGAPTLPDSAAPDRAALLAISARDGRIIKRIVLQTKARDASPGDLAVAASGDVFVSDAVAGILWQVRSGANSAIAHTHPLFRSLQGVVPSPDGLTLLVADYSVGLLHVDLSSGTVSATRVADAPGNTTVGIDGLARQGNTLVGVQNLFTPSQIVRMELDAAGTRVVRQETIDRHDAAVSPTGGVMIGNSFVYIGNSWWDLVDANGKLVPNTQKRVTQLMTIDVTRSR
jgi:sugar lactone lactonase YvrE